MILSKFHLKKKNGKGGLNLRSLTSGASCKTSEPNEAVHDQLATNHCYYNKKTENLSNSYTDLLSNRLFNKIDSHIYGYSK